jgi:transaldolase
VNRLQRLHEAGVSIWLDTLSRELLKSGEFERLVRDYAVSGATPNPTIFAKAITGSDRYDDQLHAAAERGLRDPQELFFQLGLDDVRRAADILRPVYEGAPVCDGFVSFECTPDLADDGEGTIEQAFKLWRRLDRPNVMIKVPATAAGVPAIEELTARGVNVNVTLLFSVERYEQVIEAYVRGLERRAGAGERLRGSSSVASFFVSRVDAKADPQLGTGLRPARPGGDRKRSRRARPLPCSLQRRALGGAGGRRCAPAAPALGQHWREGPRLLRRSLCRAANRTGSEGLEPANPAPQDGVHSLCRAAPQAATDSRFSPNSGAASRVASAGSGGPPPRRARKASRP